MDGEGTRLDNFLLLRRYKHQGSSTESSFLVPEFCRTRELVSLCQFLEMVLMLLFITVTEVHSVKVEGFLTIPFSAYRIADVLPVWQLPKSQKVLEHLVHGPAAMNANLCWRKTQIQLLLLKDRFLFSLILLLACSDILDSSGEIFTKNLHM